MQPKSTTKPLLAEAAQDSAMAVSRADNCSYAMTHAVRPLSRAAETMLALLIAAHRP